MLDLEVIWAHDEELENKMENRLAKENINVIIRDIIVITEDKKVIVKVVDLGGSIILG